MTRYRQTLLALILMLLSGMAVAQNNTNSPYTRYGYGELSEQGPAGSKAMGGVSYAIRDRYQVNFANPASYTAVDSMTFIFDGGVTLQNTNFSNGTVKQNAKNTSFDYLTMEFRLSRKIAMSLGMLPFSNVGYSLYDLQENSGQQDKTAVVSYTGEGGLHQLYGGIGVKLLKNLSLGANISYLWGDITRIRQLTFTSNSYAYGLTTGDYLSVKSYKLDLGAQYTHIFSPKHQLTLGVVFSPGHSMSNDAYAIDQLTQSSALVSSTQRDTVGTFDLPTTLGVGLAYLYNDRLTVALDAQFQNWSSAAYLSEKDAFCNRTRIGLGVEYLPNPLGRSYLSHVKYRVGAYYSQPYYKINGQRAANEYGVTAGFGLPIPRTRSMLSFAAQYVRTEGKIDGFLDENTLRICIGVTFNERWFFKRKVD